jgi:hypothetical protein
MGPAEALLDGAWACGLYLSSKRVWGGFCLLLWQWQYFVEKNAAQPVCTKVPDLRKERVASVGTGIGAFLIALSNLGVDFEAISSEINPVCNAILEKKFSSKVHNVGNILNYKPSSHTAFESRVGGTFDGLVVSVGCDKTCIQGNTRSLEKRGQVNYYT